MGVACRPPVFNLDIQNIPGVANNVERIAPRYSCELAPRIMNDSYTREVDCVCRFISL